MRSIFLAASFLTAICASGVQAEQLNRCQDSAGRTVYVDRDCQVYGLRHIGAVEERVTVMPASEEKEACRADARKFCREVKPGGNAIMDCLLDHQQEMSEGCYQALKAKLGR